MKLNLKEIVVIGSLLKLYFNDDYKAASSGAKIRKDVEWQYQPYYSFQNDFVYFGLNIKFIPFLFNFHLVGQFFNRYFLTARPNFAFSSSDGQMN